jgi:hypothetical protein
MPPLPAFLTCAHALFHTVHSEIAILLQDTRTNNILVVLRL